VTVRDDASLGSLADRLEPELGAMLDEQEAAVTRELPELVARIDPALARAAIDRTNRRFVAQLRGQRLREGGDAHVAFAAAAARAGVPLDDVNAGYRLGARIAWRRTATHVEALAFPPAVALRLADGWLAYADELAREAREGYERVRGAVDRAQQELVEALVAGRIPPEPVWPVPSLVVAGVPLADVATPRSGVQGRVDGASVVILDAGADVTEPIALGPAVPPDQTAVSLQRARRVAALHATGVLVGSGPLRWDDHLVDVVLHADPAAGQALAARLLAPLQAETPRRTLMLHETLEAWLAHPGQPLRIAEQLHLHPQTVRYRIARLRERLGDRALDDPASRFELQLALRVLG
jgi:hypothetical protein